MMLGALERRVVTGEKLHWAEEYFFRERVPEAEMRKLDRIFDVSHISLWKGNLYALGNFHGGSLVCYDSHLRRRWSCPYFNYKDCELLCMEEGVVVADWDDERIRFELRSHKDGSQLGDPFNLKLSLQSTLFRSEDGKRFRFRVLTDEMRHCIFEMAIPFAVPKIYEGEALDVSPAENRDLDHRITLWRNAWGMVSCNMQQLDARIIREMRIEGADIYYKTEGRFTTATLEYWKSASLTSSHFVKKQWGIKDQSFKSMVMIASGRHHLVIGSFSKVARCMGVEGDASFDIDLDQHVLMAAGSFFVAADDECFKIWDGAPCFQGMQPTLIRGPIAGRPLFFTREFLVCECITGVFFADFTRNFIAPEPEKKRKRL